jgi:FkbM family methyltransferase
MGIPFAVKAPLIRLKALLPWDQCRFLRDIRGVIHVGANTGQERNAYGAHGLSVLWIEPIPEVFGELLVNIATFARQRAICALVSDSDGATHAFHVASNHGQSSSVLPLKHHRDIWPEVHFDRTIELTGWTLLTLLERHGIDGRTHDALVLDTQGAEMSVLRGAGSLLREFRYVKVEAADFELYEGCCTLAELSAFLASHGFAERSRRRFAQSPQGGSCYDVVFRRAR